MPLSSKRPPGWKVFGKPTLRDAGLVAASTLAAVAFLAMLSWLARLAVAAIGI